MYTYAHFGLIRYGHFVQYKIVFECHLMRRIEYCLRFNKRYHEHERVIRYTNDLNSIKISPQIICSDKVALY